MQHINRLLHIAKKAFRSEAYSIIAHVDQDDISGKWTATAQVWDGVNNSFWTGGVWFLTTGPMDTAEEATDKITEMINEQYPNIEPTILIMDYGLEEMAAIV